MAEQYDQNQQNNDNQQYDQNQQYDSNQQYDQNQNQNQQYDSNQQYDQNQNQNQQYNQDDQQQSSYTQTYSSQTTANNAYTSTTAYASNNINQSVNATAAKRKKKGEDEHVTEVDAETSCNLKVFLTPRGILRPFELICSLIAWAPVITSNNYDLFDSFQFLCAMMMIVWFYCIFINLVYLFRWKVDRWTWAENLPIIELTCDGLAMCMAFVAGCVAAHRCQQELGNGVTARTCSGQSSWAAGAAFALITSFVFMPSVFYSFRENKTLDNKVVV